MYAICGFILLLLLATWLMYRLLLHKTAAQNFSVGPAQALTYHDIAPDYRPNPNDYETLLYK
jgi:hypothetical protein